MKKADAPINPLWRDWDNKHDEVVHVPKSVWKLLRHCSA